MALTPTIALEGSTDYRPQLTVVTSVRDQTLVGVLQELVVDVQVSVNGGPFRSDAALVEFDQTGFTIPNPSAMPEGLRLNFGVNTIQVRTVDSTGAVSGVAVATLEVVRAEDLDIVVTAPTGLRVRRRSNAVELVWAQNQEPAVLGYHVYAATEAGGGEVGYSRLNRDLITEAAFSEDALVDVESSVLTYNSQGASLRVLLTDEDFDDVALQTVGNFTLDTAIAASPLQVTTSVQSVRTTTYSNFIHNRQATEAEGTINNELFVTTPDDEPLFYVITAVAYDAVTNQQIESIYSSELVGQPLVITTQLTEVQPRTREEIVREYLDTLVTKQNNLSAIPGGVTRDVHIDPPASEAERLHFIADFVRRSRSFATLVAIDDLDGDGVTDPVNSYKLAMQAAFGFENLSDVQLLIDDAFDALAGNVDRPRKGQTQATGQAVFFTSSEPTTDRVVEVGTVISTQGSPSVTFETTARAVIPFADRASYYNLSTRRYEITVPIRALNAGASGNVAAGQITTVIGTGTSLQVINQEATRFGADQEDNISLAERGILAFSSVDAGTGPGYLSTALEQVGVFRALVQKARDPFMVRDWDEVRMKQIGGKVDVWVQGSDLRQVTESFALSFDVARDIQFVLDSNPTDLIFVTNDPRITPSSPITEILGSTALQISQGFGFRNATTGQDFDVTGAVILGFNRIQLDNGIAQPALAVNDLVLGDVRYQSGSLYAPLQQPIFSVTSLRSTTGNVALTEGVQYTLVRSQDPLLEGYSTRAQDSVRITPSGGIPAGDQTVVNDERQVLVGQTPIPLDNLGVNGLTVRVFNLARTVEYAGPSSANPDFLVVQGDETTPTTVQRTSTGNITNGEEVSVDYLHDENFEINYTVNNLPATVQAAIDVQSHVTADVLVKQAIMNEIDFEMTVVLAPSVSRAQVDARIRTGLSQLLNSKGIGEGIYQSDVVRVIENTAGVLYVIVPFAKMAVADDALILRETLNPVTTFLEARGAIKAYVFSDALDYATPDGGGPADTPVGVFLNTQAITLVSTYNELFNTSPSALIVGRLGRTIPGYSDDVTLSAQGFNTSAEREAERLRLTANRVFVGFPDGSVPDDEMWNVTYLAQGDEGSKSVVPSPVTYVELGQLSITYQQ